MTLLLDNLPILEFETSELLRAWLEDHHATSNGMWLRIYKKDSGVRSVEFEQVLDKGLCFGWSESARRKYDNNSYIQKFTPRKTVGTQSARNLGRVQVLIEQGKMKPSGLAALGRDKGIGLGKAQNYCCFHIPVCYFEMEKCNCKNCTTKGPEGASGSYTGRQGNSCAPFLSWFGTMAIFRFRALFSPAVPGRSISWQASTEAYPAGAAAGRWSVSCKEWMNYGF